MVTSVQGTTLQASIDTRRRVLRLGFLVANPLPDDTEPPVVSVIDFEGLGKGERFVFFFVQQAPNVHVAAITEKLPDRLAGDQTFIAEVADIRPSATRHRLAVGMLLHHVVALRVPEGSVRSGEGELISEKIGIAVKMGRDLKIIGVALPI
jgi:hypothetical protein